MKQISPSIVVGVFVLSAMTVVCGCGQPGKTSAGGKTADGPSTTSGGVYQDDGAPIPEGWGDLKVQFVYDGTPPEPKPLALSGPDAPHCAKHAPLDETVVAGPQGELANVFVWLRPGDAQVKVHEQHEKLAGQPVRLTNKDCRFEPHALTLWTRRPLHVGNDDPIGHSSKPSFFKNPEFSETIQPGSKLDKQVKNAELLPMPVSCGLHPWMKAHLLVQDHPYMAVSGPDGVAVIENLPTGRWNFEFWHEGTARVQEVEWNGKRAHWNKGVQKLAIRPGLNDIGVVKVGGFR